MVQGKVEETRRNLSNTALEARQIERNGEKLLKTQHETND